MLMKNAFLYILTFAICLLWGGNATAFTKEMVEDRGTLRCGVSTGIPGFSSVDGNGHWSGIDVDICRAVAAAVLNDADRVTYVPLLPKERTTALISGDVDILARNYAWNMTRDSAMSLNFAAVNFYDQQVFLGSKGLDGKSVLEMSDFSVCAQTGTVYIDNIAEYLQKNQQQYKMVLSERPDQVLKDFEAGRCDMITGGRAQLQGLRTKMRQPEDAVFLSDIVATVPLGPAVCNGDDAWLDIVKWAVFAMISAEQLGITSDNIDGLQDSTDPALRKFLGLDGIGGKGFGLSDNWAYRIVKQVGNYGEVYSRNIGAASPLKVPRGLNNLWNKGGILFAPPLQ